MPCLSGSDKHLLFLCFLSQLSGDSGGPIVDAKGVLVATVSWGNGCGKSDHYGINARVSAAQDWIQAQICRLSSEPPLTCHKASVESAIHRIPHSHPCHANVQPQHSDLQTPNFGSMRLRVTVQHDRDPTETSWDLLHMESYTQLYWQPYKSVQAPYTIVSREFPDLPAGSYRFRIGDTRNDGICCKYGNGSMAITASHASDDYATSHVLWQHNGNFTKFYQVTMNISERATHISLQEKQHYTSPSQAVSNQNNNFTGTNHPEKNDPEWPGAYPLKSEDHAMTINVRYDDNPEEVRRSSQKRTHGWARRHCSLNQKCIQKCGTDTNELFLLTLHLSYLG